MSSDDAGHVDALPLISRFGGIRPMATKLGVPVSTVQGWKERNAIPVGRLEGIKDAARRHDIALVPEDTVLQVETEPPSATPSSPDGDEREAGPSKDTASGPAVPRERVPMSERSMRLAFVSSLAAIVIAVLALLGAVFADFAVRGDNTDLERRVAALEGAPAPAAGVDEATVMALTDRVVVVEAIGAAVTTLKARLEVLAVALAEVEDGLSGSAAADEVAAIVDRLAALEALVAAQDVALSALSTQEGTVAAPDLTGIAQRLAALEALPSTEPPPSADVEDLRAVTERVAAAEAAIAAVQAVQPGDVALAERVAALESRRVETPGDGGAGQALALTLAASQLREAALGGVSFVETLQEAQRLAGDDEPLLRALAPLESFAVDGLEPLAALQRRFDSVARALTRAQAESRDDWGARVLNRLSTVVSVRRDGDAVGGDRLDARLAGARVKLAAGDAAGALAALGPLAATEDAVVGAWIDALEAQAAVADAARALEASAQATLAEGTR